MQYKRYTTTLNVFIGFDKGIGREWEWSRCQESCCRTRGARMRKRKRKRRMRRSGVRGCGRLVRAGRRGRRPGRAGRKESSGSRGGLLDRASWQECGRGGLYTYKCSEVKVKKVLYKRTALYSYSTSKQSTMLAWGQMHYIIYLTPQFLTFNFRVVYHVCQI